jgi:hypothetical protein
MKMDFFQKPSQSRSLNAEIQLAEQQLLKDKRQVSNNYVIVIKHLSNE